VLLINSKPRKSKKLQKYCFKTCLSNICVSLCFRNNFWELVDCLEWRFSNGFNISVNFVMVVLNQRFSFIF